MARIEKLTPEQEALMAVVRDDWLDFIFKNDQPMDKNAAKSGIAFLYGLANLKPPRVIVNDSPIACQRGVYDQDPGQVYGQVGDQVRYQVYDQIGDQVYDQVCGRVSNQVYDQVSNQVGDPLSNQVFDQIRNQIRGQVYNQIRDQKLKYYSIARRDVLWDAGWLSFYDYFNRVGVINHAGLNKYLAYARSGVFYSIFRNDYAILCSRPVHIKRDENHRLHADGAPAILWGDGWSQYYLHGVCVSAEYALTPAEKLDLKLVLTEKNADIQRELIRKVGPERLLIKTGAKELDAWQDPNTAFRYRLMEMVIGDNIRRRYLYFQHASMPGIFYAKPVPPETEKAFHARAWILSLVERDELNRMSIGKEAEIIANFPTRVS